MKHPVRNWHPASLSGHELSDDERLACVSLFPGKGFYGAITRRFDILRSFSSQEAEERDPAHSVETNAELAPQLTRLIDEAKKAESNRRRQTRRANRRPRIN